MTGLLVVRSALSLASAADDRIALNDAKDLPKIAAANGWSHCVLADERTMAGSLDFLESAKKAKISGSAGIHISALLEGDTRTSVTLFALDQAGLHRLISRSDRLAVAKRIEDVHAILRDDAPSAVNVAMALLPARSTLAPRPCDWRAIGVGAFVALADSNGHQIRAYPYEEAMAYAKAGGITLVRLKMGYMAQAPEPEFADALATVAEKAGEGQVSNSSRPDILPDPSIPRCEDRPGDKPSENGAAIAGRIQAMGLTRKPSLPKSPAGDRGETAEERLSRMAREGLERRIESGKIPDVAAAKERLEYELGLITGLGYSDYFLIMLEAIGYARSQGIPVGPGRGSAAGSLVAYSIGLTNIEPMRSGLLFERFINPERISLPDIDTDFCIDRRHEVIAHMARTYGDENVAQIATYAHRQPKAAIRDAARALGLTGAGNGAVKAIEALGKQRIEDEWKETLRNHPDPDIQRIGEFAERLHNIASHKGVHAGGLIVSDTPIREHAPVDHQRSDIGRRIIDFDMKATEASGFVKLDFLGLKTLTVIKRTLDDLKSRGIEIDIDSIPEDDPAVFEMLRKGRTRTVFQLESGGMTEAGREIDVSEFADIVALVALYRPGPMEYISLYAQRKRGQAPITYLDPCMEEITASTYGIIIYQEQIMQMARSWAGYSMPEADNLRRAIGKKIKEAVEAERATFMAKCEALGKDPQISEKLFEYVLPFALYGFNKSHAVAYATITWQTAWLKHHHTAAWLCACASLEKEAEQIAKIVREAVRYDIRVVAPDVNKSLDGFSWSKGPDGVVMTLPLNVIARVGADAARGVVNERLANGPFKSLRNFAERVSSLNKGQVDGMIGAGALDSLTPKPPTIGRPMMRALLAETSMASRQSKEPSAQMGLFAMDMMPASKDTEPKAKYHAVTPEEAAREQEILLQGLMAHEKREITSIAWRRDLTRTPNLKKALDAAKQMPCKAIAISRGASDRLVAEVDGSRRVISVTLEDESASRKIDVAEGVSIPEDVLKGKAVPVEVLLRPGTGRALISHVPEIAQIARCADPISEPRTNPVVTLDAEIDDEARRKIRAACMAAVMPTAEEKVTRAPRPKARNPEMGHLVVVPPSLAVEVVPLTPSYDPRRLTESLADSFGDGCEFHPEAAVEQAAGKKTASA